MAFSVSINNTLSSLADGWYQFKEALKTGGWTVTQSGDGTSYSAVTDLITNATIMNNSRAWYILTQPIVDGYQKFICIQPGGTKSQARVKLSWTGFNTGSPSGTVVPSAADEKVILGSGTDATPTYEDFLNSSDALIRSNIIIGDAASKYAFFWMCNRITTGGFGSLFMIDRVSDAHALDIDPYVYFMFGATSYPSTLNSYSTSTLSLVSGSSRMWCWVRKGYSDQAFAKGFVNFFNQGIGVANNFFVGLLGTNGYDSTDTILPALVFVGAQINANTLLTSLSFYKGQMVNMQLNGTARIALDTGTSKLKVYNGPYVFPWNGTDPTI